VRFTASTLSHSSSGISTSAKGFSMPALFTSRSTGPPSSSVARRNIATTCSSLETSASTATPPLASSTSSSAGFRSPM
jgi:hypothetical protein